MTKCIAVSNQKGGVGKSTTANSIGAGLYYRGFKVLYIDMDAQGNLSYSMRANNKPLTILEVLTGTATIQDAIITTTQGDIITASPSLSGADMLIDGVGKEYRLLEAIQLIKDNYDYIIIDTPPALNILTINALVTCTSVLIPTQADIYSLQGIGQLYQTIRAVKRYCNKYLKIEGLVITRYNGRTILSKDMTQLLEQTAEQLNTKLFNTKIRECTQIKEAQAKQMDIFTYASKSNAVMDYNNLIDEILNK